VDAAAAAAYVLVFSTVLWLLASATSAHGVTTSPTRWLAPCSGGSDASADVTGTCSDVSGSGGDVTGTPPSTTAANVDDLASTFRRISVKMKRLKGRVHELKNIYVSTAASLRR